MTSCRRSSTDQEENKFRQEKLTCQRIISHGTPKITVIYIIYKYKQYSASVTLGLQLPARHRCRTRHTGMFPGNISLYKFAHLYRNVERREVKWRFS